MHMNDYLNKFLAKDLSQFITLMTNVFNSIQDLVYIVEAEEEQCRFLFANQAGLSVLHVTQDVSGKIFEEVLPEGKAKFLKHYYRKAAKYKRVVTFEDEIELHDGIFIFQAVLTPIHIENENYILAVVRDVTDKNRKLQELQRSKYLLEKNDQRLSSLLENNEDAVFMFDTEGYFLEVNPATEQITGYNNGELVGTNYSHMLSKNERERVQPIFQRAVAGETVRYESVIYHKEGSEVYINVKNIPIMIEGQIIGVYGIARDITKEKKAVEELRKVKLQLESFVNDSTDCISLTNLNGEVEFINNAFTKMFGFTKDEVLKQENPIIPDWLKEETTQMYALVLRRKKNAGYSCEATEEIWRIA